MSEPRTRDRVLAAAMRLFGERGFAGTSVADIEAAAGLSAGSGGLYRHFATKQALLQAGVREQIAAGQALLDLLDGADLAELSLHDRLVAVARAGLGRLRQEQDLNRIMIKDLAKFPELLAEARDDEVSRVHSAVTTWLVTEAREQPAAHGFADWPAVAAVVVGAVSHYWLMGDVFGEHPAGVDDGRYLEALSQLLIPLLTDGST